MARKKKQPHTMEFLEGIYNFENYDGLLFVGDPHVCTFRPGTRLDDNFLETVLDKLDQAVAYAKTYNLYMVILGDLFHDDQDHNPLMLTRLIQIFNKLPHPPLTIVGNHEKTQTKLTDDTFTAALREAGVLYTIEKTKYWGRFKFNQEFYYLGGTPYGQEIPTTVNNLIDKSLLEVGSYTIWLTHHDIAIETYYPGCIQPFEIEGCDMLVNGHDHTTKNPMTVGQTTYFNPGNITRMSVDKKDHIPRVWAWYPTNKRQLTPFELKYNPNIFDLTGRQVISQVPKQTYKEKENQESKFLQLLEGSLTTQKDQNITHDGAVVEQNIKALSLILQNPEDLTHELLDLANQAAKEI